MYELDYYDVIVVGAGHAGCEAALAAARLGCKTAVFTLSLDAIANITSGAVGSDLANMVNEAAINAVKCGRKAISQDDLMEAVEVVIAGKEKKDRILSEKEKKKAKKRKD